MIPRNQRNPLVLEDLHSDSDLSPEEKASGTSLNQVVANEVRNVKINFQSRNRTTAIDKYSIEELLHAISKEVGENSLKRTHFCEALARYSQDWKNVEGRLSIKERGEDCSKGSSTSAAVNMKISFGFNRKNSRCRSSVPALSDFLISTLSSMKCLSVDRDSLLFPNNIFIASLDRYHHDYEEICILGEGGFGTVYKARHRLDGKEYALKKVQIRFVSSSECESLLGEVKLLSEMKHPNVAQYSCSWLQLDYATSRPKDVEEEGFYASSFDSSHIDDRLHLSRNYSTKPNNNRLKTGTLSSSSSSSIVFQRSTESSVSNQLVAANDLQKSFKNLSITSDASSDNNFHHFKTLKNKKFQLYQSSTDLSTSSSSSSSSSSSRSSTNSSNSDLSFTAATSNEPEKCMSVFPCYPRVPPVLRVPTLYIQMELGKESLLSWIQRRNERVRSRSFYWNEAELQTHLKIFREILLALEYIHSKGIVHRDIKPANILISVNDSRVLLADFGLAKLFLKSEFNSKSVWYSQKQRFSSWVGTPTYCAPEIKSGGGCDAKVDIYSLGIILLELIRPFSCMSERAKVIEELKKHRKVEPSMKAKWGYFINLMLAMTEENPRHRPSASEILAQTDHFCNSKKINPSLSSYHNSELTFVNSLLKTQDLDWRKLERHLSQTSTKFIKRSRTFSSFSTQSKNVPPRRKPRVKTSPEAWFQNYMKVKSQNLVKDEQLARLKRKVEDLEKKIEEMERI